MHFRANSSSKNKKYRLYSYTLLTFPPPDHGWRKCIDVLFFHPGAVNTVHIVSRPWPFMLKFLPIYILCF